MPMKDPIRILVADDEQGMRDFLSYELGARGYQVVAVKDGAEALEKIRQGKFRLVISDIKMPKMGGLEALEAIKKIAPDVEVIMSTGYGTIETAVAAMRMGAYDFIQKPFNIDELWAMVEKALEKSELKEIVAVYEASKAVFSSIQLDELLPIILNLARKLMKADDVSLMLVEQDGALGMAACLGLDNDDRKRARLAAGERVAGKVVQWKDPILISGSLENDPRFAGVPSMRDIKASILCPLKVGGEVLGVLSVNRTVHDDPFTTADMRSVTIFAAQTAQTVHNARLYRRLQEKLQELQEAYRQLEAAKDALLQSEKLAAIGELVSGIAHELNNPLTAMMGLTDLLRESPNLSEQQHDDLREICQQGQRCRKIIQNLLQFARKAKSQREPLQLAPVLEAVLQLMRHNLCKAGVRVVQDIPEALPAVLADPNQIQQVILNLINNALHAMEEKKDGRLVIKICRRSDRVTMSFMDNGCGIPKENLSRIFDPFFTTKPVGKGTGLGLSIAYGIIQEHQGAIRVESQAGVGATFSVDLPVCPESAFAPDGASNG